MKRNGFQPKIMRFSVTGAACPSGSITMHQFNDEQILAQVEALFS
jgi:heterodisulfide reductase subunit A-like polyferredoxin